jgi:hypothetical protein
MKSLAVLAAAADRNGRLRRRRRTCACSGGNDLHRRDAGDAIAEVVLVRGGRIVYRRALGRRCPTRAG